MIVAFCLHPTLNLFQIALQTQKPIHFVRRSDVSRYSSVTYEKHRVYHELYSGC